MGLGHNDPWVESHMWPQHTWVQRSSRGQWPLVLVFEKKGHFTHILWCIFMGLGHNDLWVESHMWHQQTWGQRSSKGQWPVVSTYFYVFSNLIFTMIAKVCDRESRLDLWFENRLVIRVILHLSSLPGHNILWALSLPSLISWRYASWLNLLKTLHFFPVPVSHGWIGWRSTTISSFKDGQQQQQQQLCQSISKPGPTTWTWTQTAAFKAASSTTTGKTHLQIKQCRTLILTNSF